MTTVSPGSKLRYALTKEKPLRIVGAGADMIFAEAVTDISRCAGFQQSVGVPVLANGTEFGQAPLYTREELAAVGVDMIRYGCSAYRAMNAAALKV